MPQQPNQLPTRNVTISDRVQVCAYWIILIGTLVVGFLLSRGQETLSYRGVAGKLLGFEQHTAVLAIGALIFAIFSWNARFKGLSGLASAFLLGGLLGRLLRLVMP